MATIDARERDTEQATTHAQPAAEIAPPEPSPAQRLASSVGNRSFGQIIGREGAGILPSGAVHPDVERTIAARRGTGRNLDAGVQQRFSTDLGDLSDVRVHADGTSDALARSVSARAFATGTDVYFARGEYNPGTAAGDRLIAHELAHTVQQRGAPTSGPLQVSQPGDALEREADAVANGLVA